MGTVMMDEPDGAPFGPGMDAGAAVGANGRQVATTWGEGVTHLSLTGNQVTERSLPAQVAFVWRSAALLISTIGSGT